MRASGEAALTLGKIDAWQIRAAWRRERGAGLLAVLAGSGHASYPPATI